MTEQLPLFPLHTVLFPGDLLPLHIFEPRYRLMLERRAGMNPSFGVILAREGREVGDQPLVHEIGTSALVVEMLTLEDGRSNLVVQGARRFQVLLSDWSESYLSATVTWLESPLHDGDNAMFGAEVRQIRDGFAQYLAAFSIATGRQIRFPAIEEDPIAFAYRVAASLPIPLETRQRLLEAEPPERLLSILNETVRRETALLTRTGAYAFLPGPVGGRFTSN